jgi:hypothetical protein
MNDKTSNEVLFNYIEKSKNNLSLIKICVTAGIMFSLIMITINLLISTREFTLIYIIKVCFAYIVGGAVWAGLFYLIYIWYEKRLKSNNSKSFVKPLPKSIGTVLTKITCRVTLNSVTLVGMLFIGNKGFSFIPLKSNWFKSVHKWGDKSQGFESTLDEVKSIYKSTGSNKIRDIFKTRVTDRLAIEVDDQSYFFVINAHLDNVIEDLNTLLDSHLKL